MIRRLTILLLIVGCVFGDTIVIEQMGKTLRLDNIQFTRAGNGRVYFMAYGQETSRNCNQIIELTDNEGNPIEYNCSAVIVEESLIELGKNLSEEDVESIIKYNRKFSLGGILIAFGGGLLFITATRECEDCNTLGDVEKFANGIKTSTQIGYLFIGVGGILVAIGI